MLGSVDRSYVFGLLQALALGDGKAVVQTVETLRLHGLSAAAALEEMATVLQRMAVLQAVPGEPDDSDPDAAELASLARSLPADETQLLYSLCLHGRAELGLAPDEYAALTMVLLRLLAFKPGRPVLAAAEKKTLIEAAPELLRAQAPLLDAPNKPLPAPAGHASDRAGQLLPVRSGGSVAASWQGAASRSQASPALPVVAATEPEIADIPVRVAADSRSEVLAQQSVAALVPTEDGSFWHAVVQELVAKEAISGLVRELALQAQLLARDTDQWLLRLERESLNQPGSRDRLASALQAAGHAVQLVVEVGRVSDSPARRNAQAAAERQLAAEKIIFEDPFVQTMLRDFGAKIVPGSIKQG